MHHASTSRRLRGVTLGTFLFLCGHGAAQEPAPAPADPFVRYVGKSGPLEGKKILLVSGDEEYRSEESLPQLGRQLARLGATCTVLFALEREGGTIDPNVRDEITGLEMLAEADLLVLFVRLRVWPDEAMQHIARYVEAGKPIVALRTSTHAFDLKKDSKFERYGIRSSTWRGGFGREVLGETWIDHHGGHGWQSTRGVMAPGAEAHPILVGVDPKTVWDPSDVYTVRLPLPEGCTTLLFGEVLSGMKPDDPPAPPTKDEKSEKLIDLNAPMMPVAWTRSWKAPNGVEARIFTTTLGAGEAFLHVGTRRLLVNACLWSLGLEVAIQPELEISLIGTYEPLPFGFNKHRRGVRPSDLAWPPR
ncbi:MAG: ThuA domain-containing protein [Planctomycetes bacterium]|nr:ThuA domain-containing protein [Planctomycetota bacterium]